MKEAILVFFLKGVLRTEHPKRLGKCVVGVQRGMKGIKKTQKGSVYNLFNITKTADSMNFHEFSMIKKNPWSCFFCF